MGSRVALQVRGTHPTLLQVAGTHPNLLQVFETCQTLLGTGTLPNSSGNRPSAFSVGVGKYFLKSWKNLHTHLGSFLMRFDVENFISPSEFGSFCLGNFLINFASSPWNMKEAGKLYKTYRAHKWSPPGSVLAPYQWTDGIILKEFTCLSSWCPLSVCRNKFILVSVIQTSHLSSVYIWRVD